MTLMARFDDLVTDRDAVCRRRTLLVATAGDGSLRDRYRIAATGARLAAGSSWPIR
jgi:hypothetical protein